MVAHCHYRNELRVFSIDRIHSAQNLDQPAQLVDKEKLQSFLDSSYGIFTGKIRDIAILEFTKSPANWVADEHWHPDQQSEWLENGNYQLKIPFSDTRKLLMDILKHGAEVKVVSPTFLQDLVTKEIKKMQKNYYNLIK